MEHDVAIETLPYFTDINLPGVNVGVVLEIPSEGMKKRSWRNFDFRCHIVVLYEEYKK